ncbi:hypothetical protein TSMEX_008936 [Taenia solium]|eukprot:TsM_000363500 transcript=TsM_000363500 gene=TsM_000363500
MLQGLRRLRCGLYLHPSSHVVFCGRCGIRGMENCPTSTTLVLTLTFITLHHGQSFQARRLNREVWRWRCGWNKGQSGGLSITLDHRPQCRSQDVFCQNSSPSPPSPWSSPPCITFINSHRLGNWPEGFRRGATISHSYSPLRSDAPTTSYSSSWNTNLCCSLLVPTSRGKRTLQEESKSSLNIPLPLHMHFEVPSGRPRGAYNLSQLSVGVDITVRAIVSAVVRRGCCLLVPPLPVSPSLLFERLFAFHLDATVAVCTF